MKTCPTTWSRHRIPLLCVIALATLMAACAATPLPPSESLAAATNAIASAEQAGARHYAGAELEEARSQLVLAEQAVTEEAMIEAERLAHQSRVAAELALARTESAKAVEINREMERGADALDVEMRRQGEQK